MLSPDFKEFIQSLNANDVRYLVIGGYAVAFHGHPRYTKDLDIWVDRTPANAEKLVRALSDFGFASLGLTVSDFTEPDQMVQLGYPPNRIDLVSSADGIDFSESYENRIVASVDGLNLNFIDLGDLKKNKTATGRAQDLADLEALSGQN